MERRQSRTVNLVFCGRERHFVGMTSGNWNLPWSCHSPGDSFMFICFTSTLLLALLLISTILFSFVLCWFETLVHSCRTTEDVLMRSSAAEKDMYMIMTAHLWWPKALQSEQLWSCLHICRRWAKPLLSFCYQSHRTWALREPPPRSYILWDEWGAAARTENRTKKSKTT